MEFKLTESIEILERTPGVLYSLLKGLSNDWIMNNEGGDSWSPFDIVGHLIHGEKTDWIDRMNIILDQKGDRVFQSFDRFAQFEDSKGKSMHDLLEEFQILRVKNIEILKSRSTDLDQLNLKGSHPNLGTVSLKNLLATWVAHDLGHIAQISRVMAKQYKSEVGPWEAYMPILHK